MKNIIPIIKGIHPGLFIAHQLDKKKINKSKFALDIHEYPQTFSAVTLGKRNMNVKLALKIEKALDMEEGTLMVLQAYYEIEKEKDRQDTAHPDLSKIRRVVFWDTKFEKIKWGRYKKSVIQRIFERGNQEEKDEITRFYGKETVDKILNEQKQTAL